MIPYYIFGLQRTGTQFLERVVEANYDGSEIQNRDFPILKDWGKPWKHIVNMDEAWSYDKDIPALVLTKNPYTWIESIVFRKRKDFFETQTIYEDLKSKDSVYINGIDVEALALIWNECYHHWVNQTKSYIDYGKIWILRYEDLIDDRVKESILRMACDKIIGEFNPPEWRETHKWIPMDSFLFWPAGSIVDSGDLDDARIEYYQKQTPVELSANAIAQITKRLDKYTMLKMGYKPL